MHWPGRQEKPCKLLNFISCFASVVSSLAEVTMQSSSAQVTMESQNLKRAPAWTEREVLGLIAVWGDESMLSELCSKRRNAKIFEKILQGHEVQRLSQGPAQCQVKLKELRQAYQKTREANARLGSEPKTCCFYDELHAILGGAPPLPHPCTWTPARGESHATEMRILGTRKMIAHTRQAEKPFFPTARNCLSSWIPPNLGSWTLRVEKATLLQMFQRSPYHLRPRGYQRLEAEKNTLAMKCSLSSCRPPVLKEPSTMHCLPQCQSPGKHKMNARTGGMSERRGGISVMRGSRMQC
nr:uncharacterized protein LOC125630150 [Caretta caretta]